MKKILICSLMLAFSQFLFAQESHNDSTQQKQPDVTGFNKRNFFIGGSLGLGYSNGYGSFSIPNSPNSYVATKNFNIGIFPEIGYKLSNTFDVGIDLNANYSSQTSNLDQSNKAHEFDYGIGTFLRYSLFDQFFIQVMPELDWRSQTQKNSIYTNKYIFKTQSFLTGIGYKYLSSDESYYFYALFMVDLGTNPYSPYKTYDQNGHSTVIPIIRFAYSYFLFR